MGTQVPSLSDMVGHCKADTFGLAPAVGSVLIIDKGAENRHVGRLPADRTGFDEGTSQETGHLCR